MKIFDVVFKTSYFDKTFCAYLVTTNGFALNHGNSLQIYFFCVKCQTKKKKKKKKKHTHIQNYFPKDVESKENLLTFVSRPAVFIY